MRLLLGILMICLIAGGSNQATPDNDYPAYLIYDSSGKKV